jgi:hypothetical protein
MVWLYLAAVAGVLVLLRFLVVVVSATERIADGTKDNGRNRELRERLERYTAR